MALANPGEPKGDGDNGEEGCPLGDLGADTVFPTDGSVVEGAVEVAEGIVVRTNAGAGTFGT